LVVEDAAQALLSQASGKLGDYTIFSPRKFLGVPDGGILFSRLGSLPKANSLTHAPIAWFGKALQASTLRREFDAGLRDGGWYEIFKEVEATVPVGHYSISPLSAALLRSAFDYRKISARRRSNYRYLEKSLGSIAVFPSLPEGITPLGFPVRVPDRERVLRALYREGIYPPVHWRLNHHVPREFRDSHRLSAEIMTIPCDQRYDRADMKRVIEALGAAM
jgi:dTDP-4-amino-4,6-dideoxygalactose transaminase